MGNKPDIKWSPTPYVIRLDLAPNSCKPQCPFYALANQENGYVVPKGTMFETSDRSRHDCTTMKITVDKENHFSFHVYNSETKVSLVCGALNFVSLSCTGTELTVTVSEGQAVFSITADSEAIAKRTKRQLDAILWFLHRPPLN